MKTHKVTIPKLRQLIRLAKCFNVAEIEGDTFEEQVELIDNVLHWQEIVDEYDKKVKKAIVVLNIKFNKEGTIISGDKDKFAALLNYLLDEAYYIEPMLSFKTLKMITPINCSMAQFILAKKYFQK